MIEIGTGDLKKNYCGRIAPSPTGFLHLGHAKTFYVAYQRAKLFKGKLLYRDENLDLCRCKTEYSLAAIEDLHWIGITWNGSVIEQRDRLDLYKQYLQRLFQMGVIYPCECSRKDIAKVLSAPNLGDEEPIYAGTCRFRLGQEPLNFSKNYRFLVPDGESITFIDNYYGVKSYVAGKDFGDFIVWRKDGYPSYQLAVVIDDALMQITEVVRGADLLVSTARQILLYRALGFTVPNFYHIPLVLDEQGKRLAKRSDSLSLRTLREQGKTPSEILESLFGKIS